MTFDLIDGLMSPAAVGVAAAIIVAGAVGARLLPPVWPRRLCAACAGLGLAHICALALTWVGETVLMG